MEDDGLPGISDAGVNPSATECVNEYVTSDACTGPAAIAIMKLQDSLDPGAQYAFVGFANNAWGTGLARQTPGAAPLSTCNTSGALTGSPSYFMLQRFGETIFVYASNDGKTWVQQCGQLRFTMRPNVLVGLAVASGSGSTTSTATFNSVVVDSFPPFFSMGAYMAGDYFVLQNVASGKVLDGYVTSHAPIQWGFK